MQPTGTAQGSGWIERLWGTRDTRRMVIDNLRSKEHFVRAGRAYVTHPVTIYTYVLPLVMPFTGLMKPEYPELSSPDMVGNLFTAAKVMVFWLLSWASLGALAFWLMPRGVPFVAIPIVLWLVAVCGSQALSILLVPDFQWSWLRLMRQVTLTLPATVIAVYAAGPSLRDRLGEIPELVPIWSFNAVCGCRCF